jgi:hypothetical protein
VLPTREVLSCKTQLQIPPELQHIAIEQVLVLDAGGTVLLQASRGD